MPAIRRRVFSELPSGDPALLNRIAWARRWSERDISRDYAQEARKKALDGSGHRSRTEQGLALRTLGWHAIWMGDLDEAMNYCLRAESFLPESANRDARAGIYSMLAVIHYSRGRIDLATCSVDRGLWLTQDSADEYMGATLTDLLVTRASIQRLAGERARAGITISRARETAQGELVPLVDYSTACWLMADGDPEKALSHGARAVEGATELGNRVLLPYAHGVTAACHIEAKRLDDARLSLSEARRLAEADGDERALCQIIRAEAKIERVSGNLAGAQKALRDAARIAKKHNYTLWRKDIAQDMARCFEDLGEYRAAVEQHNLAWRLQDDIRMR